jgi:tRNA-2-methylthio-N6-dimethylallyladenosine synthase
LRRIAECVPDLARLRYTSPHPRHVTPSLVAAHRDLDVLARHVHLPVQSGSNRMLKRMIRRYTKEEYVERAARLRAARSDLTLSTDIIVGFSGETDEDFQATLDLVREVGFSGLFGFKYSQRPYTPAQKLADDVPESTKGARLAELFALSEELLRGKLDHLVGSIERVLVEGESKAGSCKVTGRTERRSSAKSWRYASCARSNIRSRARSPRATKRRAAPRPLVRRGAFCRSSPQNREHPAESPAVRRGDANPRARCVHRPGCLRDWTGHPRSRIERVVRLRAAR